MSSSSSSSASEVKIDDALYSRQLYVYGHEAQKRLAQTNVLIVGLRGLGVEAAKNVILAGVKGVGLLDPHPTVISDLGAQFYLSEKDIGKPRATACADSLRTLNNYVNVHVVNEPLSVSLLAKGGYQVVLLTGVPVSQQLELDAYAREHHIKLICADAEGAFGAIFVDLGKEHVVSDTDGEQPKRGLISMITQANPGVVTCHDESRHGLSDGAHVTFEEIEGMSELNNCEPRKIKFVSPYSFSIGDTSTLKPYSGTRGYYQQVKVPVTLTFKSLKDSLTDPDCIEDFFGTSPTLHALHNALSQFRDAHSGKYPRADSKEDADKVTQLAEAFAATMKGAPKIDSKLVHRLARCGGAEINPIAAVLGGIVGQEVLKAASGKFSPIKQFYYFSAAEILPKEDLDYKEFAPLNSRYDDQIAVLGRTLHEHLAHQRIFVVGAGAIGCEMLKNFALMGVATSKDSQVLVTDMDTIEKSNLNRQFLFRPHDVGQMKSQTAAREARKMNPQFNVVAHSNRVAAQTEEIYDDEFWESLSAVCTALDNVDARLYVDGKCVYYHKPLIDSGTLGTKGSTQVVVPFETESYGSSRDPPEEGTPVCTLRNFPNKIDHTIQWARDLFEGLFKQAAEEVNAYLTNPAYLQELAKQPNIEIQSLTTIRENLILKKPRSYDDCLAWARHIFENEFNHKIRQLLHVFPEDSRTTEGLPFWSGPKRAPKAVTFDVNDPLHYQFVTAAANLRASIYHIKPNDDHAHVVAALAKVHVEPFKPEQIKIATTDAEAKQLAEAPEDDHSAKVAELVKSLPPPASSNMIKLSPVDFEKDDDKHMLFVSAASNLRARNYAIKEANLHETRGIAGKIIPAIATTTALVTGLVCIEYYKLLQKKPLEAYRNFAGNLALPSFYFAEPMTAPKKEIKLKSGPWKYSLWDKLEVDIGDVTLEQLVQHFEDKYGLELTMLSFGAAMLYYSFSMPKKKARLASKISELIKTVAKVELREKQKFITLEAQVNYVGDADTEVDIPQIRFRIK